MKKILSFVMVLVLIVSLIPFALADEEETPSQNPETGSVESPAQTDTPTSTEPSVANEIAEQGAILQKNEDGTTTSTLDVVTPEKTCEHKHAKGAEPTKIVYEAIDEATHQVTKEYVCDICGLEYLDRANTVVEEHALTENDGIACLCGFSLESLNSEVNMLGSGEEAADAAATPTPTPTSIVYDIIDTVDGTDLHVAKATYSDGTLTVTKGTDGQYLPDYVESVTNDSTTVSKPIARPWTAISEQIKKIVVDSSISRIGDWAFAQLSNLKDVFIGSPKVSIGDYAFADDTALEDVNFTSTIAKATYDNSTSEVTYDGKTETGSTAYYGDGDISINYNCQNKNTATQKKTEFVNVNEKYGCYHNNPTTVYGYAPTETAYGLTDGVYCKSCNTWVKYQYKIYPLGKAETGTFEFINILTKADNSDIPEILKGTSLASMYDTNTKLEARFKEDLGTAYKEVLQKNVTESARVEMPAGDYVIYEVNCIQGTTPADGINIFNIPYPNNTYPSGYNYVVLQLQEDGSTKELDTFLTNTGIQVETETLMPVGITWIVK